MTQPNIRFVGGMNVPAVVGRANGTVPLGVLTVEDGRLCLRPRSFAAWMLTDFSVPLDAIAAAFPLRPGLMRFGVGFEMTDGQVAYFWTRHGEDVLHAMASQGVRVDPEPRPASAVWRLRSPRGTTVARPQASRLLWYASIRLPQFCRWSSWWSCSPRPTRLCSESSWSWSG